MNILFFLHPKSEVKFLYGDSTVRQGLEKMKANGYTAIPVISRDGKYIGTVSEGDFLWYIINESDRSMKGQEKTLVTSIMNQTRNPEVRIDSTMEDLINRAMDQNFVPVVDDRGVFVGIITRRDIIKHLVSKGESA